jgi:hypothetical protein
MTPILKESGSKVRVNFSTFSMIAKSITSLIDFVTKQRIGKIEFISEKWNPTHDVPTLKGTKHDVDSIAKFIVDFDKKSYIKLINGKVETKETNVDIGELFGDLHDLIKKNNVNKYTSVYVYRKMAQESKLIETYIRKIVKKVLSEQVSVRYKDMNKNRLIVSGADNEQAAELAAERFIANNSPNKGVELPGFCDKQKNEYIYRITQ